MDVFAHELTYALSSSIVSYAVGRLLLPDEITEMARAGQLPRSRRFLAVPFVGKDAPSPSSEYAHPDVAIGARVPVELGCREEANREALVPAFHVCVRHESASTSAAISEKSLR